MFRNILVPLDGSRLSEASVGAAALLAHKLKSHVTLLHVIEQDAPAEIHKERHLTNAAEAETYLEGVAGRFDSSVKVKIHVHSAPVSHVARSIVEHAAAEFMPDLIVISTHGSSGVRGLLFGSIAQQVVAQGKTPLLLIKPDSPKFKLEKILLPLDPDSRHDDSLPLAESLAKIFKAELALLSVILTYATLTGEQAAASSLMPAATQAMLDVQEENALEHLKQHVEEISKRGIAASATVRRGDPAQIIVKTAEQSGADLIALSTHGKSGIGAFWARSVSPKVAQRTKTPVLLIPLSEPT